MEHIQIIRVIYAVYHYHLKSRILSFKEFYTIDEIEKGLIELGKIDYQTKNWK